MDSEMMWMKYAACRGLPVDVFMPKRGEMAKIRDARKVCSECAVMKSCRDYSIEAAQSVDLDGVFGGWTKNERLKHMRAKGIPMRRTGYSNIPMPKTKRKAAHSHGTASAYRKHLALNELPCEDCYKSHQERLYRQASESRKRKYQ